jgi:cellulose synthase/poly-beta-1,6-N-acetylglucosamine synthase-like glycosyltransferase
MILLYQYLFWISFGLLVFPYIVYPLLLKILAIGKTSNTITYTIEELPAISILIAAHNEEAVIEEKLQSIFSGKYPPEKMEILIGSDSSTDRTNEIISVLSKKYSQLKLKAFTERTGKVNIINKLAGSASNPILVITDANVIFDKDTLVKLIRHFKNPAIALVDTNMLHKGLKREGISYEESFYIRGEVSTKYNEGILWGTMMGPFGGCYALRKEYFTPVPENFLVDDFYINMKVLENGGKAITEVKALVFEDVSNELMEEFRRKIRIATGSFQNLFVFTPLLFRFNAISFCFMSHKVLRWKGPLFIIIAYVSSLLLVNYNNFFHFAFYFETFLLGLVPMDFLLQKIGVHIRPLRLLRHFFFMNLAILIGMFKALTGVKSSIWEPTVRNQ